MLCMAMMQQLFKDGFVEKYGERGLRPPKVKRLSPEDGGFSNVSENLERGSGGWVETNSTTVLTQSMKFWGIDDEINVAELPKRSRNSDSNFKAELRLVISTKGRRVPQGAIPTVSSKIELYSAGTGANKKDAKGKCALNMVLQLYKYQILGPSHYGTKPGPKAREFSIARGQVSSQYSSDDLAIMQKLNEFRPKPGDLEVPNRTISHIEAALRLVSDWVHEDEYHKNRKYSRAGKRSLIGVQRVGPIAMDLTLFNERRAHLVLTAARKPTKQLLKTVCELTPQMLKSCENLHVPFKSIQNQKISYHEREMDQLLANEEWEYVSDDTASEDEAEMDAEEAVQEEKERIEKERNEKMKKAAEEEKRLRDSLLKNLMKSKVDDINSADECELPPSEDEMIDDELSSKIIPPTRKRIKDRQERRAERAIRRTELKLKQQQFLKEKSVKIPNFYTTKLDEKSSGFLIYYGIEAPDKMLVRVTLTSSVLRRDKNKTNFKIKADESLLVNPKQEVQEEVLIDDCSDGDCLSTDESSEELETTKKMEIHSCQTEESKLDNYSEHIQAWEQSIIEKESGLTNIPPAIGALTELRRIKWFASVGAHVPYLHNTVRLIRGLSLKEQAWYSFRPLCPWIISLIARHVLIPTISKTGGSTINLSPVKALIKILETIANGFKFPMNDSLRKEIRYEIGDFDSELDLKGATVEFLQDPVEKVGFDALSLISEEKKMEIVETSKMALDLIKRNNCEILIGVKVEDQYTK